MKFSSTPFRRHTWPLHRPRKCRSHTAKISEKKSGFRIGDLYRDCNYRPMRATHVDWYGDTLEGVSLLDGVEYICGFYHCDPKKISKEEAQNMVAIWKKDGERGLMILNGWTPEDADQFLKDWRDPKTA